MRRLVLILAVLAIAAPAAATEALPGELPVFLRSEAWLHGTSVPVTNVDGAQGTFPSWDETKPSASEPFGAGAVYASNNYSTFSASVVGEEHDPSQGFTTQDTFLGELDTMAMSLFAHKPAGAVCTEFNLAFDLRIDGEQILYQAQTEPSANLTTNPVADSLYEVRFVFTRLHEAMTEAGLPTGPDIEHTIYVNAMNFYACDELVWVYDSAEAPAGIVFNGTVKELKSYTKIDVFNPPPPLEG